MSRFEGLFSTLRRIEEFTSDATEGLFRLIEYTLVAGTLRWLANHSDSVFLDILSYLSLALLLWHLIMLGTSLIHIADFSELDTDAKVGRVIWWISAIIGSLFYCAAVYYAVETIAFADNPI